jgi:uncharacterized membrane protein YozB (DUF420 family)
MAKVVSHIGLAVFFVGVLAIFLGLCFWYYNEKSSGSMDTEWGRFSGPVWFVLVVFGLVLMVVGVLIPF